ncbi:MAG: TlyA family RNA methyltransferase [Bacillota bacterium]
MEERETMGAKKRPRLDRLLVERGLFEDEGEAARWVLAGQVIVDGQRVDKPGTAVATEAEIRVKGLDNPYVGRGGLKLAGALADFAVDVGGRVCLDAGASTGGFSDCLLHHGAAKVYAVDVGHGQLDWKLKTDPRVVDMERTNLGDVSPAALPQLPSLATLDLSYLSLRAGVPMAAALLAPGPDSGIIALVKPLFELRANAVERFEQHREVLEGLIDFLAHGEFGGRGPLPVLDVTASPILGSGKTIEFFIRVGGFGAGGASAALGAPTDARLDRALELAFRLKGGQP